MDGAAPTRRVERTNQPGAVRAAVVGFQGFGNVGDEAILAGIEGLLGSDVHVSTIFAGGVEPVAAFAPATRIRTWRHLPTFVAWRALRRVDALLIGGGGLVNDYWATVIPRYVAWCLVARLAGRRVVWVGAGIGPIRRRPWRWLAGLGFRASRLVLVRDDASAAWVRRCHQRARVAVIPDPAFFVAVTPIQASPSGVGIVARGPAPLDADRGPDLARTLATVAVDLQSRDEHVELISMHPSEDRAFFAQIEAAVAERGGTAVPVVWLAPVPDEALACFARFRSLLTVRLHGLILGGLVGVPSVAVAYDRKVREAATLLGLGDLVVPLADASPRIIADALDRLAHDPGRGTQMRTTVDGIRSRRGAVADLVTRAITG